MYMNFLKALIILVFIQSLNGCSKNNTKECSSNYRHKSSGNSNVDTIKTKVPEKTNIEENIPSKNFSGIQSVEITTDGLLVKFIDQDYFEKYSTEQTNIIERTNYDAHPIGGVLGGVGFGLFLVSPQDQTDFTVGCHEDKFMSKQPDLTMKTNIGHEWHSVKRIHKILVSGFDRDYEFTTGSKYPIDLSLVLLSISLSPTTTLKITCLDCNLQDTEAQSNFKDIKTSVTYSGDFRNLKRLAMVKRELFENTEPKNKLTGSFEQFKSQCQELGFKIGTKDYGNCVLDLNENR